MNAAVRFFTIFVLAIASINQAVAQKASFTTNSGMTIGFGLGASYQKSDIANTRGAGFDFTLGHHFYKKENAFLSADWKFRFLAGENKAFDHRINTDGTYNNIRFAFFNYDLEVGLTLNRLRERTRIVITGFAGAGITHGRTFTDLYDGNGALYDYSVIDPNQSKAQVNADLVELSDNDFETRLVNKAAVMPTLGIFLGYQFSRSFTLGIEHKTNFSLTENNSITGINIDNNILAGSRRDRNHYTSLSFRWSLGGRSYRSAGRSSYSGMNTITARSSNTTTRTSTATSRTINTLPPVTNPTPVKPVTPPVRTSPPVVKFINPPAPVTVEKNIFRISVQTANVRNWQDVTVRVNGISTTNFSFSPEGVITTNIGLNEGPNNVEVAGKNESGSATDRATITYLRPVKAALPEVNIIIPGANPYNTGESSQEIRANITEVKGKDNISVSINGIRTTNFTFDINSMLFRTSVSLNEGRNEIIITARNDAGQDVKSQVVIRAAGPCSSPSLRMVAPAQNGLTTDSQLYTIRTEVKNVARRDQLFLTINEREISNFNFNGNEVSYSASLVSGSNAVVLVAKNSCGAQTIISSIIYKPAEVVVIEEKPCPKPGLNFSVSTISQDDATHQLKGTVSNVKNRSAITLTVDGTPDKGFQFVPNTGELSASFKLNPGTHTIVVNASNECGQDSGSKNVTINEESSCGPRINPGNALWQFCLVTPTGTFNRDNLANSNFSYSGRASSLFFMPIAGGGDAIVNGKPYRLRPGQYYLFSGNMTVNVSTKNPGSMGQWSVCITADKEPVYGSGNNRPKSTCEETKTESVPRRTPPPQANKKDSNTSGEKK